jgi:hypothetical protein
MTRRPTATAAQLRHEIDQGHSGNKVRALDPAAAPLGTDEEAAGTPVDPHLLAVVRRREKRRRPRVPRDGRVSQDMDLSSVAIYAAIIVGLAIGIVSMLLLA